MTQDKQSLRQRLTTALTRTSQQLLEHFKSTPVETRTTDDNELPPNSVRHSFSSELFAELLIELPEHRNKISQAYEAENMQDLGNNVHQLLGAIVYCDAPELEVALRSLHRALATADQDRIEACYLRALNTINSTLSYSGFGGSR
jgi:hypothetical protein